MTEFRKKNEIERSRDHLANERTFLSWIRTSIALMGFGFVIEKFTLFLEQLSIHFKPEIFVKGYSSFIGIIIVAIGVFIAILAFIQYRKNYGQLTNGYFVPSTILTFVTTLIVITGGVFLVFYLISNF